MDWISVSSQNLYVEDIISNAIFGSEGFGKWLGVDEIVRVEPFLPMWGPPTTNQEEGPQQTLNVAAPWHWASQPPEMWKISFIIKATWSMKLC